MGYKNLEHKEQTLRELGKLNPSITKRLDSYEGVIREGLHDMTPSELYAHGVGARNDAPNMDLSWEKYGKTMQSIARAAKKVSKKK